MQRTITMPLCVLCVCILFAVPIHILKEHYSPDGKFLGLIYFGQKFTDRRLPEVAALSPPAASRWGYDGQFYAQIALRPTLVKDDIIQALDNPSYRARRIGLPLLAGLLGLGDPGRTLHIYSMLNAAFWVLLLFATIRLVGLERPRDFLLLTALLWTTGSLASMARALTDLPAAALGFLALLLYNRGYVPAVLLGMTALIKDVSMLGFAAIPWAGNGREKKNSRLVISALIMLLPIILWVVYVHLRVSSGSATGSKNFSYPLVAFTQKVSQATHSLKTDFSGKPFLHQLFLIFEFLCPLSLCAQSVYFCVKMKLSSEIWRFGIGFVVLFSVLGASVWQEQFAYSRVLLPLTFAFNLLLHRHEQGKTFTCWYFLGNVGMFWLAVETFWQIIQ